MTNGSGLKEVWSPSLLLKKTDNKMNVTDYIEAVVPENIEHYYLTRDEMVQVLKTCWAVAQKEFENDQTKELI